MSWIKHPVVLENETVRLVPLAHDHFPALVSIARSREIWEHLPLDGTNEQVLVANLRDAVLKRIAGEQYPFTVFDKATGNIIGSTRLFEIFENHRKLEIGWTWYDPAFWGRGHNLHCKLLLLEYCFTTLNVNRVQLKTRNTNERSQAAIRKIGATMEGVLRKDRVMPNGEVRDTVIFSIVSDEWPAVRERLLQNIRSNRPAAAVVR